MEDRTDEHVSITYCRPLVCAITETSFKLVNPAILKSIQCSVIIFTASDLIYSQNVLTHVLVLATSCSSTGCRSGV